MVSEKRWEEMKKDSPNVFKEIPLDKIGVTCEGCGYWACWANDIGDKCEKCGLRWDQQSTWGSSVFDDDTTPIVVRLRDT